MLEKPPRRQTATLPTLSLAQHAAPRDPKKGRFGRSRAAPPSGPPLPRRIDHRAPMPSLRSRSPARNVLLVPSVIFAIRTLPGGLTTQLGDDPMKASLMTPWLTT